MRPLNNIYIGKSILFHSCIRPKEPSHLGLSALSSSNHLKNKISKVKSHRSFYRINFSYIRPLRYSHIPAGWSRLNYNKHPPSPRTILNLVRFFSVNNNRNLHHFLTFKINEVHIILKDILRRAGGANNAYENEQRELQNTVDRIVANVPNLESLLKLEAFLPVIDLFQKESTRVEVCRKIMEKLRETVTSLSDMVIINAVMHISKILNDSVK